MKPGDAQVTMDPSIYRIISSVPQYVRLMSNDRARGEANAIVQAFYARQILQAGEGAGDGRTRGPKAGAIGRIAAVCTFVLQFDIGPRVARLPSRVWTCRMTASARSYTTTPG